MINFILSLVCYHMMTNKTIFNPCPSINAEVTVKVNVIDQISEQLCLLRKVMRCGWALIHSRINIFKH